VQSEAGLLKYGKGIYLAPRYNLALQYANTNNMKSEKILLGVKVVMGKTFYSNQRENHFLKFDPIVYDSIYGDPSLTNIQEEAEICI